MISSCCCQRWYCKNFCCGIKSDPRRHCHDIKRNRIRFKIINWRKRVSFCRPWQ